MVMCEICEKKFATRKLNVCDVCVNDFVIPEHQEEDCDL